MAMKMTSQLKYQEFVRDAQRFVTDRLRTHSMSYSFNQEAHGDEVTNAFKIITPHGYYDLAKLEDIYGSNIPYIDENRLEDLKQSWK
jgi:hypothetical protein